MNEATRELQRKDALRARRETLKARLVRERLDPSFEFTIAVGADDAEALMSKEVEGSGGRQSLLRAFQASLRPTARLMASQAWTRRNSFYTRHLLAVRYKSAVK
jgi:hypothetical protein